MMTRSDRIKLAKEMIQKDMGYRAIMKKAHLSPNVIGDLKREAEGTVGRYTEAYRMCEAKNTNLEIALALGLEADETLKFRKQYLMMKGYDRLDQLYNEDPEDVESLLNLNDQLSFYGIAQEDYLEYIANLQEKDEVISELDKLQNQKADLTSTVRDKQQECSRLDKNCRATKQRIEDLISEAERLTTKIVHLRESINDALDRDDVKPFLELIRKERRAYNLEQQKGYIVEYLGEPIKQTVQFDSALTWRIATASYSPADVERFLQILMEQAEGPTMEWLEKTTSDPESFAFDV